MRTHRGHQPANFAQVLLQGLWIVRKLPVGSAIELLHLATEGVQEQRNGDSPGGVDGVHDNLKFGRANGRNVHQRQTKNRLNVAFHSVVNKCFGAQFVHFHKRILLGGYAIQ